MAGPFARIGGLINSLANNGDLGAIGEGLLAGSQYGHNAGDEIERALAANQQRRAAQQRYKAGQLNMQLAQAQLPAKLAYQKLMERLAQQYGGAQPYTQSAIPLPFKAATPQPTKIPSLVDTMLPPSKPVPDAPRPAGWNSPSSQITQAMPKNIAGGQPNLGLMGAIGAAMNGNPLGLIAYSKEQAALNAPVKLTTPGGGEELLGRRADGSYGVLYGGQQAPIKLGLPGGGQELVGPGANGKYGVLFSGGPPKPTEREQRIADLEKQLVARGMPATQAHDYAVNVTDHNLQMHINPVTGAIDYTNMAQLPFTAAGNGSPLSGAAAEIPFTTKSTPVPAPQTGQTMWDAAGLGTGPLSATAAGLSDISGMFGLPVAKKTIQARQRLKLDAQSMVRALSNNPRFPVNERKWLTDQLDLQPGIIDNPQAMRARMQAVDSQLRTWREQALRTANNPNMPVKTRAAQKQKAEEISNFLALLGVPQGTGSQRPATAAPSEPNALPEGWSVQRVQ